jgi:hypothetical protein
MMMTKRKDIPPYVHIEAENKSRAYPLQGLEQEQMEGRAREQVMQQLVKGPIACQMLC